MLRGNQHGGFEYDDLQNWLDMTSHENPLLPQLADQSTCGFPLRTPFAMLTRDLCYHH